MRHAVRPLIRRATPLTAHRGARRGALPWVLVFAVFLSAALVAAAEETPVDPLEQALKSPAATGLMVREVIAGSQAEALGFAVGDVLVGYDGVPTPTIDALRGAIGGAVEKPSVLLKVVKADGSEHTYTLQAGPIGVQLMPVTKGAGVGPLPPATGVRFDFASLAEKPHDDWYRFELAGQTGAKGFEHAIVHAEEGTIVMRREVAFDGGDTWGINHMDVTVVVTADPVPRLVSWRFVSPRSKYVGTGRIETREGKPVSVYSWEGQDEAGAMTSGSSTFPVPQDLPVIPSYLVETLATLMPREIGACFHYRVLQDGSGQIGRPTALYGSGPDEVEIDGALVKAFRYEIRQLGGAVVSTFWIGADGHGLKADYGGATGTRTTKAKALEGLHPELSPRTAD